MLSPDVALAQLINRTSQNYQLAAPTYMTYRERTHVSGANRTQDINRTVAVRVADNFAVMRDLPNGEVRTGEAFPIIPYFDPLSSFSFSYFANLKRVDITLERGPVIFFPLPAPDPSVTVTVPYNSFWAASYASDSTPQALHFTITPTSRVQGFYPADIVEDPQTQLPSHIDMRIVNSDQDISLDYRVIDGHWVIVHGIFSATEHVAFLTFMVTADVTYDQFTFPTTPPDAWLAGTPAPTPSP